MEIKEKVNSTKHKNTKRKILISLGVIILGILTAVFVYGYKLNSNVKKVEVTPEDLGITTKMEEPEKEVDYGTFRPNDKYINIALFGVDTRTLDSFENTRADSIMVLSINRENKSIKLASVARDTYVNIEGYGMDKINHAYAYGGPNLLVKTLNQNFDLNITDYAVVNFFGMGDIIDRLKGVDIEVDEDELQYINGYIDEVAKIKGVTTEHITSTGVQSLTGIQAVAYSRIRYTAGGDFKRTERQREVLLNLAKKSDAVKVTDIVPIVDKLSTNLMTTIAPIDIVSLGADVLKGKYKDNLGQNMFPEAAYAAGDMINGIYYYVADLNQTKEAMNNFFYGNNK